MEYHAPTKQFTVSPKDIEYTAENLLTVIRHIRQLGNRPLTKYAPEGALEEPEFAQQRVIEAAKTLGIDLGAQWGYQLDVSDTPQ